MKYYKSTINVGHVGCGNSMDTVIYIEASNITEAQKKCRSFPMVKHNKYNAVPLIKEITKEEYDSAAKAGHNAYSFINKGGK